MPITKMFGNEEAQQVLQDIHEGDYRNNSGGRNLSFKVLRMGYYWTNTQTWCIKFRQKVWCMSKECSNHTSTIKISTPIDIFLAIYEMGDGHCWKDATSTYSESIHVSYDELLLQIDWSRGISIGQVQRGNIFY